MLSWIILQQFRKALDLHEKSCGTIEIGSNYEKTRPDSNKGYLYTILILPQILVSYSDSPSLLTHSFPGLMRI